MKRIRRKKIVDYKLQVEIIGLVAFTGFLICFISVMNYRYLSEKLLEILQISRDTDDLQYALAQTIDSYANYFIVMTLLSIILTWAAALYLSNRIAGPIYNINRIIDKHLAGEEAAQIQVRKRDFFSEHAEKINKLLEKSKQGKD